MNQPDYITSRVEFNQHHKRRVKLMEIKTAISPCGFGSLWVPDRRGVALAEWVASIRQQHAVEARFKPTNGQPETACAEDHRMGAYGELAVACVTGHVWHDFGGADGPDVGDNFDVKTHRSYRDNYLIVTPKVPPDYVLVLATVDLPDPTVFIRGWMMAEEARRVGKLRKHVTSREGGLNPTVHESELHPMWELPGGNAIWLFSTPQEYVQVNQKIEDGRLQF